MSAVSPAHAVDFALLSYPGSDNIGDDIQSIAARAFLPRVDHLVPREALDSARPDRPGTRLILNGWFMHQPRHWPPHDDLVPLPISFHLTQGAQPRLRRWRRTVPDLILSPGKIGYLRRHGPVGARDTHTLLLLRSHGIESYLSGCLTLTLERPGPTGACPGRVVACDLPPPLLAALRRRVATPPVVTTHEVPVDMPVAERFARAESLLSLYAGARAVVTTRLHCALPCLAMGTPVLFIDAGQEARRIEGALDLLHCCSADDLVAGNGDYDPEAPPANPARHLAAAEALRLRVRQFVAV